MPTRLIRRQTKFFSGLDFENWSNCVSVAFAEIVAAKTRRESLARFVRYETVWGAHSGARLDGARDSMSPAKGLNDIEAQIAALEAKLGGIESDAEEDEASSRSGDSRSGRGDGLESAGGEKKAKKAKKEKKEKKAKKAKKEKKRHRREVDDASDSESLERVPALPAHMLPEHAGYAGKGVGKRRKTKPSGCVASGAATATGEAGGAGDSVIRAMDPFGKQNTPSAVGAVQPPPLLAILAKRKALPRCDVCAKDFTSQAQLDEHRKGRAHWRAARDARAAAHGRAVPARRSSDDGRGSHASAAASRGVRRDKAPDGPHCALCRKTFTSEAQRAEHESGKWHKMRVAGTLAPSAKPYA